jgi:zinc protease
MYKKTLFTICIILFTFTQLGVFAIEPDKLTFSKLQFNPPEPAKTRLSNGITVYLLEDHELPLFTMNVLIKRGTLYEPLHQTGIFSIFADSMRTGGTTTRSPDYIDDALESMAASIDINFDDEYGIATLDTLSEDIPKGLELFADMLMHPSFNEHRLDISKAQEIEKIRRRNEDPFEIALRHFPAYMYGKNNPMGSYPEISGIQSISRPDLLRLHRLLFQPDDLVFTVTGDFNREQIIRKLETLFGNWHNQPVALPALPHFRPVKIGKPVVLYISKDVNQSTILMGYYCLKRTPDHPDYFPIRIMREILGESSFTSRLYREVREKRGLAYSVGSYFDTSHYIYPGLWFSYAQTRSQKTIETAELMLQVMDTMRHENVSDEELDRAKDSIVNSFVFAFSSSTQIALQKMLLDFRGFPEDYLNTYTSKVRSVTPDQIRAAAQKYLDLENIVIVIVGNEKHFDAPVSRLGTVTNITQ